jgi:transposase InsO family protein
MKTKDCFFHPKKGRNLTKYQRWREVAKILKLSKDARNRLEWMIFYYERSNCNASLTSRHFGISRKTFHKWHRLFTDTNLKTLEDRSRAPIGRRRPEYTEEEVQRMIALHLLYPTLGREKLAVIYEEEYQEKISSWTARRIIQDFKLYAKRAVKSSYSKGRAKGEKKKRITDLKRKPFNGFLLELDTVVMYFSNEKRYILTAIDHHSRFSFAYMYKTKSSKNAADFLKRLYLLYGGQIENIHIDNGSEFKKEFIKAAKALGITLYHSRPYQPKDKPLIERFNGILKQEFVNLGNFTLDVEEFNRNLLEWMIFYNYKRPHHSLGLKRPADYVNMKSRKVLPMWSPKTQS